MIANLIKYNKAYWNGLVKKKRKSDDYSFSIKEAINFEWLFAIRNNDFDVMIIYGYRKSSKNGIIVKYYTSALENYLHIVIIYSFSRFALILQKIEERFMSDI